MLIFEIWKTSPCRWYYIQPLAVALRQCWSVTDVTAGDAVTTDWLWRTSNITWSSLKFGLALQYMVGPRMETLDISEAITNNIFLKTRIPPAKSLVWSCIQLRQPSRRWPYWFINLKILLIPPSIWSSIFQQTALTYQNWIRNDHT